MTTSSSAPVTINVGGTIGANGVVQGGTSTTITPGQMLTPAQYIAVQQVIHTGQQTLLISGQGDAIGGYANFRPSYASNIGSLTVPQNVAINSIGFNSSTPLNILGATNIMGSVFNLQTAPNITSVLNLGSLNISSGGLLSGYLPSNANLLGNVFASNGMNLNVVNSIVNQGTITTPGV
ncbi:MAG: hypothetical protein K2X27_09030, partial [Candidatus Obscuribacterales bacterium]|nr:hypothetical protein [Candidatus Obscuribacterales bacterium]